MHSDPLPETTLQTGDAQSRLYSNPPPPKEIAMKRHYGPFKPFRARAAAFAAALAVSATLLIAIVGAFYSVSSEPMLADSPHARSAVAGCDTRGDRVARQHCVRRLIASAKAHDAGASQLAALVPRQRGARQ
jgi:hypothetical protein